MGSIIVERISRPQRQSSLRADDHGENVTKTKSIDKSSCRLFYESVLNQSIPLDSAEM